MRRANSTGERRVLVNDEDLCVAIEQAVMMKEVVATQITTPYQSGGQELLPAVQDINLLGRHKLLRLQLDRVGLDLEELINPQNPTKAKRRQVREDYRLLIPHHSC